MTTQRIGLALDESNSIADTSTICTFTESIQLSLPESFDENLSINGIPIVPDKCSHNEIRCLHAQVLASSAQVQHLSSEKEATLKALKDFEIGINFDHEYEVIKQTSPENRSFIQNAKLQIYEKLSTLQHELQSALERAKNSSEIAEQQQQKASNAQILCDQRISNIQEALDASNERRSEVELKCKDLQSAVIELQEKGHQFDDLLSLNQNMKDETVRLRTLVDQKQKEVECTKECFTNMKIKLKDTEKKIQSLEMDKSFLNKEKCILVQRTEKTEERCKQHLSDLREATIRCDDLTSQLGDATRVAKAESEAKAASEIQRVRGECDQEIERYRTQVETSYKRELSIISEAKDETMLQLREAKNEIQVLRTNLGSMTIQKDDSIQLLQKSLSDCRSDVKVKCIEASRLQLLNEKFEHRNQELESEVQLLTDQVEAHRSEFSNLEKECTFQRKQFLDEIERKDEQLEMYYQSQVNASMTNGGHHIAKGKHQTHFLDKAKQLENRNSEMQETIEQLKNNLDEQKSLTKSYKSKLNASESEIKHLVNQVHVNEEKFNSENGKAKHFLCQQESLKDELNRVIKERDRITTDFTFLLEKYHQLIGTRPKQQHIGDERDDSNLYYFPRKSQHQILKNRNSQLWIYDAIQKKAVPTNMMHYNHYLESNSF